jgi:hypothetical protein
VDLNAKLRKILNGGNLTLKLPWRSLKLCVKWGKILNCGILSWGSTINSWICGTGGISGYFLLLPFGTYVSLTVLDVNFHHKIWHKGNLSNKNYLVVRTVKVKTWIGITALKLQGALLIRFYISLFSLLQEVHLSACTDICEFSVLLQIQYYSPNTFVM